MQFQPELNPNLNTITACGNNAIKVNHTLYTSSLWVEPDSEVKLLTERFVQDFTIDLFNIIVAKAPEVVLIGTGTLQYFLPPALLAPFNQAHIGVECMSSNAACRTYNVLMNEGRHVLALILLPQ